MTNVSIGGSIKVFRANPGDVEEAPNLLDPDYLQIRERAERAAAKQCNSAAARSVHQELALLYSARRGGRASS
jgi:hypothetical protein